MLSLVVVLIIFSVRYISDAGKSAEEAMQITLQSMAVQVQNCLDTLSNITMLPYVNTDIMRTLNSMESGSGSNSVSQYELNKTLKRSFLEYLQLTEEEVNDFLLLTKSGSVYFYSKSNAYCDNAYPYQQKEWYQDALQADGKAVYIGANDQDYIFYNEGKNVFSVARVIKNMDERNAIAMIIVNSEVSYLSRILKGTDLDKEVLFTILDSRNRTICSEEEMTKAQSDLIRSYAEGKSYSIRYQVRECAVGETGWRILAVTDSYGVFYSGWHTYLFLIIMLVLYLFLNQVMFHLLSNRTLKPLKNLATTMKAVQSGNLEVRYQVQSEDEVGELGQTFNDMLAQIKVLMEEQERSAVLLKKAEYHALQSQIEPHFIYNVLSNFAGLNRLGERELMDKSINELAAFMRYMLSHAEVVTLSVEIGILEKYGNLLKLRFGDRLETVFSCDLEFQKVLIPKLLLQPLIENSVVHGIEPAPTGGYVSIICERAEDDLLITIADNGVGFNMDQVDTENSVGIKNVRERLLLFYRDACFRIKSGENAGTVVEITIPVGELKYENTDCG